MEQLAIRVKYFITSPSGAFNLRQPINKLHAIMCLGVISTNVHPPSNVGCVCTLYTGSYITKDVYKTR